MPLSPLSCQLSLFSSAFPIHPYTRSPGPLIPQLLQHSSVPTQHSKVQGWHSGLPSCTSALCTPVAPATFSLLMEPELLSKQEASFSLHFCRISSPECPNPREMIFLRIPVISVISIELCVSYLHLTPESIPSSL